MALTKISTGGVKDDTADEAKLKVSNAGTNGQFLSKQSGNTGGLTWATVSTDLSGDTTPQLGGDLDSNDHNIEFKDRNGTDDANVLNFGAGDDMRLYSDGTNGYLQADTELRIGTASNTTNAIFTPTKFDFRQDVDITNSAKLGIGGAYGSSGQVLTSGGSGAAPSWTTVSASPEFTATASGALAAGDPVALKTNGQVEKIQQTNSLSLTGAADDYTNYNVQFGVQVAYDSDNDKIAVLHKKSSGGDVEVNYGTLNGTTLTFTTANHEIYGGNKEHIRLINVTGPYFCAVYRGTTGNHGIAFRLFKANYTAGSVSLGTGVEFIHDSTPDTTANEYDLDGISATKGIFVFKAGTAIYGNVVTFDTTVADFANNTTVTGGTNTSLFGTNTNPEQLQVRVNKDDPTKALMTWKNNNNYAYAAALTISGTSVSVGTALELTTNSNGHHALVYTRDGKWVQVMYGASNVYSVVLTISGTTVSKGSDSSSLGTGQFNSLVWDSNLDRLNLFYQDNGNNSAFTMRNGSISGTDVTWSSATVLGANGTDEQYTRPSPRSAIYSPTQNYVYGSAFNWNSDDQVGFYARNGTFTRNWTDYIGFSKAAYSNGATATVQVAGSVNENQSSLTTGTTYYVSSDGSLTTTADNPNLTTSLEVGRAISATKLLIQK